MPASRWCSRGRERGAQASHTPRPAPGVQADRFLRGGVSRRHRLHVLDIRGRVRGRADGRTEDRRARRRPEPDRTGHRVRLLLRAGRARDARGGYESIMVNCNPETVSTDYDTSDRLYFEPLTLEDVLEIIRVEQPEGVIVQYGGQTPLKLARALEAGAYRSWAPAPTASISPKIANGSSSSSRPANCVSPQPDCAHACRCVRHAAAIGYPFVVRPSYVLGGRAMKSRLRRGRALAVHAPGGGGIARIAGAPRRRSSTTPSRSTSTVQATGRRY